MEAARQITEASLQGTLLTTARWREDGLDRRLLEKLRYHRLMNRRIALVGLAASTMLYVAAHAVAPLALPSSSAQSLAATAGADVQRVDEEYTRLIRQHLQDPRISTELVDHLPASDSVPSPLEFFGRIVGTPGELTYAKDIHRYYEALARS